MGSSRAPVWLLAVRGEAMFARTVKGCGMDAEKLEKLMGQVDAVVAQDQRMFKYREATQTELLRALLLEIVALRAELAQKQVG